MKSVKNPTGVKGRIALMLAAVVAITTFPSAEVMGARRRPTVVRLPRGFQPEGIVTRGPRTFFVGSIPTGDIYKGNLVTKRGSVFIDAADGRSAIGLALRSGMLFVAGGQTGEAYVYDASSGDEVESFTLTTMPTFVNDVHATADGAYFTDSMNPVIYKIPISNEGELGDPETISITGDLVYQEGFNANGIEATADGSTLILVQSNTGKLFTVDAASGDSNEIDLGDENVQNGDGILLDGETVLWVLQNQQNTLTKVSLSEDLLAGEVLSRFSHSKFDVPTTLDRSRGYLAVVNARFGNESPESARYWVTQLRRRS